MIWIPRRTVLGAVLAFGLVSTAGVAVGAPAPEVLKVWPGQPAMPISWSGAETALDVKTPGGERTMHVLTNVTEASLTVYRPAPGQVSGAAIVVAPGGAFGALAWDLEGTEVAQWLADRGVTAFVLKYRVGGADAETSAKAKAILEHPGPEAFDTLAALLEPRRQIAVSDAEQAVRLIRSNAARYGIAPDRVGIMGFSAGGMTTMGVVIESDPASRPDFAASIYGAMRKGAAPRDGPPVFLVHAEDDTTVPVTKSLDIFQAWRVAGRPAELHVYPTGGHGFGLGRKGTASVAWPQAFEAWLIRQNWAHAPAATPYSH